MFNGIIYNTGRVKSLKKTIIVFMLVSKLIYLLRKKMLDHRYVVMAYV